MRYLTILLILFFMSCNGKGDTNIANPDTPDPVGYDLIILSGQSNMARFDVDKYFTPIIEEEIDNSIIVKDAEEGSPISDWLGDDILYNRLMDKVYEAIDDKEIRSVTFVWMQGESDALQDMGSSYEDRLRELFELVTRDLGYTEFIVGRLSRYGIDDNYLYSWEVIRDVQVSVGNEYGTWVDTDDIPRDGIHYSEEGYAILGEIFADSVIDLISY